MKNEELWKMASEGILRMPFFVFIGLLIRTLIQQFYAFELPKNRQTLRDKLSQELLEQIEHSEWRVVLAEYELSEL